MNQITAEGTKALDATQVQSYWDDGFVFPIPVFSGEEAAGYRARLEQIESQSLPAEASRVVGQYMRVHAECVMPLAAQMALHPKVLDVVEAILGPNIMIWAAEFFVKEARSDNIVSMHQDLTYWGFGETSDQVTAWIALSPATVESGCMDLVRASHKNPILPHTDTHARHNLLSRGQEVDAEVAEQDKTHIVLQPGDMSLHHGLAIHGSGPNTSDDRRIGFAIRYINPDARQQNARREYAVLARGVDRSGSFIHYAPPTSLFSSASLTLYEEIRASQDQVLAAGLDDDQQLYRNNLSG